MHMAWVRQVCGRLESRLPLLGQTRLQQLSLAGIAQREAARRGRGGGAGRAGRPRRAPEKGATLADLYDPLAMPRELTKAHAVLDRAVDRCYRSRPFSSDRQRVEFLFALYEKLTAPLVRS